MAKSNFIAIFLSDERQLICEQLSKEQLLLRFRDRKGGHMDYCLLDKVTLLTQETIPHDIEYWKSHHMLILQSKSIISDLNMLLY